MDARGSPFSTPFASSLPVPARGKEGGREKRRLLGRGGNRREQDALIPSTTKVLNSLPAGPSPPQAPCPRLPQQVGLPQPHTLPSPPQHGGVGGLHRPSPCSPPAHTQSGGGGGGVSSAPQWRIHTHTHIHRRHPLSPTPCPTEGVPQPHNGDSPPHRRDLLSPTLCPRLPPHRGGPSAPQRGSLSPTREAPPQPRALPPLPSARREAPLSPALTTCRAAAGRGPGTRPPPPPP